MGSHPDDGRDPIRIRFVINPHRSFSLLLGPATFRTMSSRTLVGVAIGGLFLAGLVASTLRESRTECEVCLDFGGQSTCRVGSGADRESAVRGAVANACAILSTGVTAGMQCDRTPPRSVSCSE